MIYIQDRRLKLGNVYLPGIINNIEVSETGKLEDKKKGKKTLSNQPTGWEAATVKVEMYFEENTDYTLDAMVRFVQNLFKQPNQTKQKKYKIVEAQMNARGISEVYFNEFSTSGNESESWIMGTMTFVAPVINGMTVVKTKTQQAAKTAASKKMAAKTAASAKKKKTTKKTSKSPVKKKKSTSKAKAKAKKVVKKK